MNIVRVARDVTGYVEVAVSLFLAGAVFVAGCSDEPGHRAEAASLSQQTQAIAPITLVASSEAGTGCAAGSSSTRISADGLELTTTFSNFLTQVNSSTNLSVQDCQLNMKLRIPADRSFSVQTLSLTGYALLGEGVVGRQFIGSYFMGRPGAPVEEASVQVIGPYDRSYQLAYDVPEEKREWSQCGSPQDLAVSTLIRLEGGSSRRAGYMNMASVDGSAKLVVRLETRPCESATPSTPADSEAIERVARVKVVPGVIERTERFTVSWDVPSRNRDVLYRVQVRTPVAEGDAVFWESPDIYGNAVRYDGPALPFGGTYQVLVIALRGTELRTSDRMALVVRDTVSAALDKPTGLRVQPSPIRRSEQFVVSWTASVNASQATVYRVEVRTAPSAGGRVVAQSDESAATVAAFPALAVPSAGRYEVVVVAREPSRSATSDALSIEVVESQASTPAKSPLLGRYAARSQVFGGWASGNGALTAIRELYLAEFVEVGNGIELRTRLCAQETSWVGFTLDLTTPEAYPEIRRKVTVEGNSWHTDGQPFGTGYAREGVPECAGKAGRYVPKRPEQRWIRGSSCRCPTAIATAPTLDDCRITDPDGDGYPGLAYNLAGSLERLDWISHYATVVRTHPERGVIEPNGRHHSQVRLDELGFPLACQPAAICSLDPGGAVSPCVSSMNRMEFIPLPSPPSGQSSWTCATLRGSAGRLFVRPLATVRECQRDKLTGP